MKQFKVLSLDYVTGCHPVNSGLHQCDRLFNFLTNTGSDLIGLNIGVTFCSAVVAFWMDFKLTKTLSCMSA